jgi:threonine dehydratase
VGGSIAMGDVAITIDMETKGHEHSDQVLRALRAEGFQPVVMHV